MTTYTEFVPGIQGPFTFQLTLDGESYQAVVTWNLYGQRWYISVYELTGELVFCLPLIGSSNGVAIESMTWANGIVTVDTAGSLGFNVGTTMPLTIAGCSPAVLNGIKQVLIVDEDHFTFSLDVDPGIPTQLGRATYDINMAAGYFEESVLVYRARNRVFEVSP